MFKSVCPKCQRDLYSAKEEPYHICPCCGIVFSKTYGSDRRREERFRQKILFDFPWKEKYFDASTIDISGKGLSIMILGEPLIKVGETIGFPIGDLQINAKIVWINKQLDRSIIGLQRLN
ncbi:MAG: PilZ domain-containing protein [Nitrospirota bacterium]